MPYQFPPDLDERVRARMLRRGFQSEDDVLREAMDALEQLDEDKLRRWREGNELAMEQSRLELSKPLELDKVLQRVEDRAEKWNRGQ